MYTLYVITSMISPNFLGVRHACRHVEVLRHQASGVSMSEAVTQSPVTGRAEQVENEKSASPPQNSPQNLNSPLSGPDSVPESGSEGFPISDLFWSPVTFRTHGNS